MRRRFPGCLIVISNLMCKIEGVFAKQYCLRSRAFALHFRVIVFYVRIARKVKMLRAFLCFACGQHRKVVRAP